MFPPFRGCDFFFDVGGPEAPKLDLDIQTPLMALQSSGFIYTKPSNQIMSRVLLDFFRQTMSFFHLPSLNLTWLQKTIDGWKIKISCLERPSFKVDVRFREFLLVYLHQPPEDKYCRPLILWAYIEHNNYPEPPTTPWKNRGFWPPKNQVISHNNL